MTPRGYAGIPLCGRDGEVRAWSIVDPADVPLLSQWSWSLGGSGKYAVRWEPDAGRRGGYRAVRMHRFLAGLDDGFNNYAQDERQIDHINRNKLDNRRSNLRVVTKAENMQNIGARGGNSRFRGVYRMDYGRYRAYAVLGGVFRHIGVYATEDEAASAASAWRSTNMPFSSEDAA